MESASALTLNASASTVGFRVFSHRWPLRGLTPARVRDQFRKMTGKRVLEEWLLSVPFCDQPWLPYSNGLWQTRMQPSQRKTATSAILHRYSANPGSSNRLRISEKTAKTMRFLKIYKPYFLRYWGEGYVIFGANYVQWDQLDPYGSPLLISFPARV